MISIEVINMVVIEYKCPCCGAALAFEEESQKLACEACGNEFELDAIKAYNEPDDGAPEQDFRWEQSAKATFSEEEEAVMNMITCPSCGGEIISDANTAATFCPFCENPAVITGRVTGGLRPDGVLPFKLSKEDAKKAFANLCKGKPLLPRDFASQQRLEKISGIYVPFWLYDCDCTVNARYRATRTHTWSDSKYRYVRTEHFLLLRSGGLAFEGIPVDGSQKMDNAILESIEPFDYSQIVDFDTAYLSGFLADKYDVSADDGKPRVEERVTQTADSLLRDTCAGYLTVTKERMNLRTNHAGSKYVLLPVWMLHSKYQGKTYVFAMNGQTGKMTGTFPISTQRCWTWFGGIAAAVTAVATAILMLL